jgi:predicted transcriptional regulator
MSSADCTNRRVPKDGPHGLRVRDAMIASPKTLRADVTVADLRAMFANPHVATAVFVDGDAFAGVVRRDALRDDISGDMPVRGLIDRDEPTIEPDADLAEAVRVLDARSERRLVVVDPDGRTLRGLLCLTSDRSGFCQS